MEIQEKEGEQIYVARLVHGDTYWLKDRLFVAGRDYAVSEAHMLHLSEHATFTVPTPGFDEGYDPPEDRTTVREMFSFRPLGDGEEIDDVEQLADGRRNPADEAARRARVLAEVRSGARRAVRRRDQSTERD